MFSQEKIQALLPIGSVVSLNGGKHPLMIVGICQTDADHLERNSDYLGVLYPEGYLGTGSHFFFQHESIDKVIFEGYRSADWEALLKRITTFYEENA